MHRQFEELCALAATGQISAEAMELLSAHLKECDHCRGFLEEIAPLRDRLGPVLAASHARDTDPPEGIRERFLQRAAAEGLNMRPGPTLGAAEARPSAAAAVETSFRDTWFRLPARLRGWNAAAFRVAIPVGAALACGCIGYFVAQARTVLPPVAPARTLASAETRVTPSPTVAEQTRSKQTIAKLEAERAESQRRLARTSAELARLRTEKRQLVAQLATTAEQAAAGDQYRQQFQATAQKLQDAQDRIGTLEANLRDEWSEQMTLGGDLEAQRDATAEANQKLANVQAQLARERRLGAAYASAKTMIAERNLHIVDIYDTSNNVQYRRPIGRVFYVEGKSLVFYAYDLPSGKHLSAKIAFHVWGETAGVKGTTYNLGIMRNDGSSGRRWKLAFNDPKVLTRIDAVYVTAEPGNKDEPQGKRLMYAFLGGPNVP